MPTVTSPASIPAVSPDPLCTGRAHPRPHGSLSNQEGRSLGHSLPPPWADVTAFQPKPAQASWTPPGSPGGPQPHGQSLSSEALADLGGASPESQAPAL